MTSTFNEALFALESVCKIARQHANDVDEKSRFLQNRENLHNITVNGGTGSDGIVYRGLNFICKQLYSRIASVAESLHTLKKNYTSFENNTWGSW